MYFVVSRIRPLPVRIFFSHPLPPLALGLVRAALDAELAGPPDDPGEKKKSQFTIQIFYKLVFDNHLALKKVSMCDDVDFDSNPTLSNAGSIRRRMYL